MINHIWSILCRRSVIDQETNNISLYDVLEQLKIDLKIKKGQEVKITKVGIPIDYEIVSMWVKPKDVKEFSGTVLVECLDTEGKQIKKFELPMDIPANLRRMRSRLRIKGIEIDKEGVYTFKVNYKSKSESDYKHVADLPLEIVINREYVDSFPDQETATK